MKAVRVLTAVSLLGWTAGADALELVPRTPPISGRIVAKKTGETEILQPLRSERAAEVRQDLKTGDVLRTKAAGTLAILFADRTQIRLGRNAVLLVKAVQAGVPSRLELQSGALWGRAVRESTRLSIETPAANAGIRGTSWSVVVDGDRTVLQVYEGRIDFSNPQGRLSIGGGEAAQARVGEAPTRLIVVNPDEREQMLFYLPLTDAVRYVRPFSGTFSEQIAARNRLVRIPPERRSAEEWLQLAETGAELDNDRTRLAALSKAKSIGLDASQRARAALVDALVLLSRTKWQDGLKLLQAVLPELDATHKPTALAAIDIASSVVDPSKPASAPADTTPELLAAAFAASYRGELQSALEIARRGEALFPANADFLDLKASLALLLGDRDMLASAVQRGLALEPDHPGLLTASAHWKAEYLDDLDGAQREAEHAVQVAPGNSHAWNILGLVYARRYSTHEAEHAFAAGIANDPDDAAIRANRAVALLDANEIDAAEAELAKALQLDPQESLAHSYKARAFIQRGDYRAALQELLTSSAMNPTHAQTLLLLAYVYNRLGDRTAAEQQIELAERYDPLSPFPAAFRSVLDLDAQRVGPALAAARSALDLSKRVHREDVRADRFLFDALRTSGLNDWARSYSDRYFDPGDPASYFEQAAYNRANPYLVEPGTVDHVAPGKLADRFHEIGELPRFKGPCFLPQPFPNPPLSRCPPPPPPPPPGPVFNTAFFTTVPDMGQPTLPLSPSEVFNTADEVNYSSALQGLVLDPLALSSSRLHSRLFREAFNEVTASGSTVTSNGSTLGNASFNARGLDLAPIPFSYTVSASHFALRNALQDQQQLDSVHAAIGSELTPDTSLIVQMAGSQSTDRLTLITDETLIDDPTGVPLALTTDRQRSVESREGSVMALLSQDFGVLRLTAGGAYTEDRIDTRARDAFTGAFDLGFETLVAEEQREARRHGRAKLSYFTAGGMLDFAPTFIWVGMEHVDRTTSTRLSGAKGIIETEESKEKLDSVYVHVRTERGRIVAEAEGGRRGERTEYGAAFRWEPSRTQAFAAGFQSRIRSLAPFTLEPVELAGLLPDAAPTALGTRSKTFTVRWEGELSAHLLLTAEAQRQNNEQLLAPAINAFLSEVRSSPYLVEPQYVFVGAGRVDRFSITANCLLTPDLAFDATAAATRGKHDNYLPREYARGELVWSAPGGFRATLAATYFGDRRDDRLLFGRPLKAATLIDAGVRWLSPRRNFEAGLNFYNGLDQRVDVYNNFPRYGRAAVFSAAITY